MIILNVKYLLLFFANSDRTLSIGQTLYDWSLNHLSQFKTYVFLQHIVFLSLLNSIALSFSIELVTYITVKCEFQNYSSLVIIKGYSRSFHNYANSNVIKCTHFVENLRKLI